MSLAKICAQCSALLPDDAADGALCPACAAAATFVETALAGSAVAPRARESIGDYEIIDKLGQGGMGAVYRARQRSLGRVVALKVLPDQFDDDAEFISRFQREAKVAASLQHANLIRVFSAGQADGSHFIAMELIEGENLHQRLRRERISIPEALRICADVARGLQCGWDRAQLIHRDIKPSNIYLSHAGEVKVGDLGLAKSLTANTTGLTQTGTMMGTPHYMSPEQIRGDKALDFRADIYSLGCTLYEMLTGQPPYPGSDPISIAHQHINAPLPAIMRALPGCPMPLVRLVGKMLKKSARERHTGYDDLIAEFDWVREQIEQGTLARPLGIVGQAPRLPPPPAPPPTPAGEAPALQVRSKRTLWIGIAAGVLVLGVLAFVFTRSSKSKPAARVIAASTPAREPARPAPELPASVPSAAEGWRDVLAELWAKPISRTWLVREAGGSRVVESRPLILGKHGDVAVRATVRGDTAKSWKIQLHFVGDQSGSTVSACVVVLTSGKQGKIHYAAGQGGTGKALKNFDLPPGFSLADRHTMEVRVLGDTLTCILDNREVATVKDDVIKGPGETHFICDPGAFIEKLEVRELAADAPSAPQTGATASALDPNGPPGELFALEGHTAAVRSLAFLPGRNDRAVSASWDKTVRLWDLAARKELRRFEHPNFVNAVAPTPIGNYMVAGDSNGQLVLWNLDTGQATAKTQLPPGGGTAQSISISSRRGYGVAGNEKGDVYRFEVIGLNKLTKFAEPVGGSWVEVAHFPDGDHVLIGGSAGGDKPARLCKFNVGEMRVLLDYPLHDGAPVATCDVSADGKWIAAALGKHGVRIWDAATGKVFRDIASASYQTDLRFVGNGATLATGTHTGTLRIWDRSTGTERPRQQSAAGWVTTHIDVSAAGRFALTGGGYRVISKKEDDGHYTLHLWRLP